MDAICISKSGGLIPNSSTPGIVTSTRYEGGLSFPSKDHGRLTRQRELRAPGADKRFADPILTRAQKSTCLNGMWPGLLAWEGQVVQWASVDDAACRLASAHTSAFDLDDNDASRNNPG